MRDAGQRLEQRLGARLVLVVQHAADRNLVEEQALAARALVDHEVADRTCGEWQLAARAWPHRRLLRDRAARGAQHVAIAGGLEPALAVGARDDHRSHSDTTSQSDRAQDRARNLGRGWRFVCAPAVLVSWRLLRHRALL